MNSPIVATVIMQLWVSLNDWVQQLGAQEVVSSKDICTRYNTSKPETSDRQGNKHKHHGELVFLLAFREGGVGVPIF